MLMPDHIYWTSCFLVFVITVEYCIQDWSGSLWNFFLKKFLYC